MSDDFLPVDEGTVVNPKGDMTPERLDAYIDGARITETSERGEVDYDFDLGGREPQAVNEDGVRRTVDLEEAILLSSESDGWHRPVIDIDVPARLVPSSTPGHHHLYIDVDLSWDEYRDLLTALANAGIVEDGYVLASVERKATHVRLPWVKKKEAGKYDPDAILADPDAHPIHKMIAAINVRVRDHGERWAKCANCGDPYQLTGDWTSETVCSERCGDNFSRSIMGDL